MTKEQVELLKALYHIKNYCFDHDCETCALARHNDDVADCMFASDYAEIPNEWELKPLPQEEEEKIFTVFR